MMRTLHSKFQMIAWALFLAASVGCDSGQNTGDTAAAPAAAPKAPEHRVAPKDSSDVIALVSGRPLRVSQLQPLLIESVGGEVLGTIVLDEQIARELEKRELTISEDDVAEERNMILNRYPDDPDQGRRVLEELRLRLRVGPRGFDMFFRRQA